MSDLTGSVSISNFTDIVNVIVIENVTYSDSGYIPSGDESNDFLIVISKFIGITFMVSLVYAICLLCAKPPEDWFVKRALIYLILALTTRVMMATSISINGNHETL